MDAAVAVLASRWAVGQTCIHAGPDSGRARGRRVHRPLLRHQSNPSVVAGGGGGLILLGLSVHPRPFKGNLDEWVAHAHRLPKRGR